MVIRNQKSKSYLLLVPKNVRLKRHWEPYYCIKCSSYSQNRRHGSECKEGRVQKTVQTVEKPLNGW